MSANTERRGGGLIYTRYNYEGKLVSLLPLSLTVSYLALDVPLAELVLVRVVVVQPHAAQVRVRDGRAGGAAAEGGRRAAAAAALRSAVGTAAAAVGAVPRVAPAVAAPGGQVLSPPVEPEARVQAEPPPPPLSVLSRQLCHAARGL